MEATRRGGLTAKQSSGVSSAATPTVRQLPAPFVTRWRARSAPRLARGAWPRPHAPDRAGVSRRRPPLETFSARPPAPPAGSCRCSATASAGERRGRPRTQPAGAAHATPSSPSWSSAVRGRRERSVVLLNAPGDLLADQLAGLFRSMVGRASNAPRERVAEVHLPVDGWRFCSYPPGRALARSSVCAGRVPTAPTSCG